MTDQQPAAVEPIRPVQPAFVLVPAADAIRPCSFPCRFCQRAGRQPADPETAGAPEESTHPRSGRR